MPLLLVIAFVLSVIFFLVNQIKRPNNFPPGPRWMPLVGNLRELKKLSRALGGQYLALQKLADQFKTNVLGLKLGRDYVVTVFSYPVVRAVLTGEEYEGRPDNFFIRLRSLGTRKGVTCTDGPLWTEQRFFAMKHLRNLGYGKKTMENMIQEELGEVLEILEREGPDLHLGPIFAPSVINVIWSMTTGNRISRNDPRLQYFLNLLYQRSRAFDMSGGTLSQLPWLRHIAPEKTGYNLLLKINAELKRFFTETIALHHKDWYPERQDDLIYSFITQMKKEAGTESTFTDDQLIMVCLDLFIAGSATTSNTLDFIFLILILYPEVQDKAAKELDTSLKPDEPLTYAHRLNVPYVEAVIMEVERFFAVAPIIGPRRVLRDTTLEGYNIPKNTTVLISLYSVHFDVEYWGDPFVFRPERFLNEEGRLVPNERVMNFGLGRRRCLGEQLARQCIFLFFAGILRKFKVNSVGNELPSAVPLPGLTLSPQKYKARLIPRNNINGII